MKKIIYDGSYFGYLNALEKALKENFGEISSKEEEELFAESFNLETDAKKAGAFANEIRKLSAEAFKKTQLLYLSETPCFENTALGYLKNAYKYGPAAENNLADKGVSRADKLCKKVLYESHRFKGFIRFSELEGGIMFAKIAPEHNILPLLKSHFRTRFGRLNFVIYDEKRNRAIINRPGHCEIMEISDVKLRFSENEKRTRELWKNFFKTIEIKERKKPKLQKSFVPLKYRRNITEFE